MYKPITTKLNRCTRYFNKDRYLKLKKIREIVYNKLLLKNENKHLNTNSNYK